MSDQYPDKSKYELSGKTDTIGLDYNIAALVCYLPIPPLNFIASLIWLMTEPKANLFVRFHAMQGLMMLGGLIGAQILVSFIAGLSFIPFIGPLFGIVGGLFGFGAALVWFVGSIVLMLKAKDREMYKLPYIGDLAEKYAQ